MEENLELSKARDFGQLVSDTFLFTRQNWKPLFKAVLYICGFLVLAAVIVSSLMQSDITDNVQGANVLAKIFRWEFSLSILLSYLLYILVGLTTFSYMSLYKEKGNQPPTVEEVWSYVKYFFWRYAGGSVLSWFALGIGALLCLIPGLYLFPIVSIMLAMMVFENAGVGYVIDRSFKLIKNEWWTVFGGIMVVCLVLYALSMAVILPVSVAGGFLTAFLGVSEDGPKVLPLLIVINVFSHLMYFLMVILYVVTGLAYFSLLEKKEGTSLFEKIDNIGKKDLSSDLPEEEY